MYLECVKLNYQIHMFDILSSGCTLARGSVLEVPDKQISKVETPIHDSFYW
jgi:hypothetical protein